MSHSIHPHTRSALRRAVRFACTLDVDGVGTVAGVATDLSARGLWVVVEEPLEIGVLLNAKFRLPRSGRDLDVVAEVTRVDANSWGFGMGLRFRSVAPSDRVSLDAVLRGLPPRLPPREVEVDVEEILYAILVEDAADDGGFITPSDDELERVVVG